MMDNPTHLAKDFQIKQLTWFGHVNRMIEIKLPRFAMIFLLNGQKKKIGRPRKIWQNDTNETMREFYFNKKI